MTQTGTVIGKKHIVLIKDIRALLKQGTERARQRAHQEFTNTYWLIGQRISRDPLIRDTGYGTSV